MRGTVFLGHPVDLSKKIVKKMLIDEVQTDFGPKICGSKEFFGQNLG